MYDIQARGGRKKGGETTNVRTFWRLGGGLLYDGRSSPELRSNTPWRPHRGYESTPLATGTSIGTILANRADAGLWNSLELKNKTFFFLSQTFLWRFLTPLAEKRPKTPKNAPKN
jgi:hypothetical protein